MDIVSAENLNRAYVRGKQYERIRIQYAIAWALKHYGSDLDVLSQFILGVPFSLIDERMAQLQEQINE